MLLFSVVTVASGVDLEAEEVVTSQVVEEADIPVGVLGA